MSSTADEAAQPSSPADALAGERIPLAPIPAAAPDPSKLLGRLGFLDGVLAFLVLAFAFLAACTKSANSDLLLHLATGRLIAGGSFPFSDPFTFTAGPWVNHAWLLDLVLYACYSVAGEAGLTILKALGFAGVAWLVLRAASKPGERLWIPAFCALLAMLALSPRMLLNPMLASLLVLSGLVALLARHAPGSRAIWAAPVLCGLWANLDAWFFLGPLLVLLYVLGHFIDLQAAPPEKKAEARGELPRLALVAGACLLACLANPWLWQAFLTPPPELARYGAGDLLAGKGGDRQFRGWQLSLWDADYYHRTTGLSPAGLAFFPLAFLSLASFVLAFPEIRWWRVLSWLATLALALASARTVPFFAVVAGAVMSLNFLEASSRLLGSNAFLLPN
ncbi:MAG: hypothetical protein K2W96_27285, partial [Gemmataceae bacterium]|nr:hypothetical protein [Gemmataceae bacterium]